MPFFVYILYSEKCNKHYVGHTNDLEVRLAEHNLGKGGHFSKSCGPWILVYAESYATRVEAVTREREIKRKKSRRYIEWLISSAG